MSAILRSVLAAAVLAIAASAAQSHPSIGGAPAAGGHAAPGGHSFTGVHSNVRGPTIFRGRDLHHLSPLEFGRWRSGHWQQGWHGGRFGWWWWVDGGWYWYDQPIYPYPLDISDVAVVDAPPGVAGGNYWWWCEASNAYWPYVRTCATPWRAVAPTPPQ
jgi:hypothetical protein